ncbi:helix-turn-helix transcriptional regulator [Aerococcaceae bacterium DSM 111020]|nr:helix-turn-helix transcriptional regulator [Aerococcaceae bacterium DSM 111020]
MKEKYSLKELRALNGISRKELAERTGLNYNTILGYENDISKLRKASYENLENLAKNLNVGVDDIFLNNNSV